MSRNVLVPLSWTSWMRPACSTTKRRSGWSGSEVTNVGRSKVPTCSSPSALALGGADRPATPAASSVSRRGADRRRRREDTRSPTLLPRSPQSSCSGGVCLVRASSSTGSGADRVHPLPPSARLEPRMRNPDNYTHTESPGRTSRLIRNRPSASAAVGLPALFVALHGMAVVAQAASKPAGAASTHSLFSKLQPKAKKAKRGKRGRAGPQGPQGPQGLQGPPGESSGPAGGALAGAYPDPTLNVSGGDNGLTACKNGESMVGLSAQAVISCSFGVYSDASANVAAGPTTFPSITTGSTNSALGSQALNLNTTGSENSAFGEQALASNTTGSRNTGLGQFTLEHYTTGNENAAVGEDAIPFNTSGSNNTGVGWHALNSSTTGTGNVALGDFAGGNLTNGSDNIDIDNVGVAGDSATTRIGTQGTQTGAFMAGVSGVVPSGTGATDVVVDENGQLGVPASSRRLKRDIHPLGSLDQLMKLRPVSFRYRSGAPELHYGLIAEQVAKVLPRLAVYGTDGLPEAVQYQELPTLLLAKVQAEQRQSDALRAQNRSQQAQIDRLMRRVRGH